MTIFFQATIAEVGQDVPELLEGGILIFYAAGAAPELAEVSVLHVIETPPTDAAPPVGSVLSIGTSAARLTAIGERAWKTVGDIGHVVVNFNGAAAANRPGELCAEVTDLSALKQALVAGCQVTIAAD